MLSDSGASTDNGQKKIKKKNLSVFTSTEDCYSQGAT